MLSHVTNVCHTFPQHLQQCLWASCSLFGQFCLHQFGITWSILGYINIFLIFKNWIPPVLASNKLLNSLYPSHLCISTTLSQGNEIAFNLKVKHLCFCLQKAEKDPEEVRRELELQMEAWHSLTTGTPDEVSPTSSFPSIHALSSL